MMTEIERKHQRKLEAKLQSKINAKKSAAMQAKTGNAVLSSSFWIIQEKMNKAKERYGYVQDLNKAA